MKRTISLLLSAQTLLLLTAASLLFSSCIIVGPDHEPEIIIEKKTVETTSSSTTTTTTSTPAKPVYKYSITCKNETSYLITDWCVKKDNIVTYANSGYNRSIRAGGQDMILDLPEGYYKVYFSFEDCYQLQPEDYYCSESIYLDKDVTYCLYERQITVACRSAGTEVQKPQLYLKGSDGSEIDLICK